MFKFLISGIKLAFIIFFIVRKIKMVKYLALRLIRFIFIIIILSYVNRYFDYAVS